MASNIGLRQEALSWRLIQDEVVVLDLLGSKFLSVNGSGSRLWKLLARGSTRSALTEELVTVYGLDSARATEDVDGFLASLASHGLLEHGSVPGRP